jgi:hypothetical protein
MAAAAAQFAASPEGAATIQKVAPVALEQAGATTRKLGPGLIAGIVIIIVLIILGLIFLSAGISTNCFGSGSS